MDGKSTNPRRPGSRKASLNHAIASAVLALMKVAAVVGALVAVSVAGLSIMAFDAPGSGDHVLPYVILAGAWLPAVASVAVLMRTNRLLAAGRTALASTLLLLPPAYAGGLLLWLRFG